MKKEDRGVEKKKRAKDGPRVHFPGGSTRAQGNCSFRGVGLGGEWSTVVLMQLPEPETTLILASRKAEVIHLPKKEESKTTR